MTSVDGENRRRCYFSRVNSLETSALFNAVRNCSYRVMGGFRNYGTVFCDHPDQSHNDGACPPWDSNRLIKIETISSS